MNIQHHTDPAGQVTEDSKCYQSQNSQEHAGNNNLKFQQRFPFLALNHVSHIARGCDDADGIDHRCCDLCAQIFHPNAIIRFVRLIIHPLRFLQICFCACAFFFNRNNTQNNAQKQIHSKGNDSRRHTAGKYLGEQGQICRQQRRKFVPQGYNNRDLIQDFQLVFVHERSKYSAGHHKKAQHKYKIAHNGANL